MRDPTENQETGIDRRTVLKGAAVGAGIAAMPGLAAAKGHGGGPCHKDFACEDGTYVKFEFYDDDECYFQEETDTELVSIDSYTSKEGETCEPISVEWSVEEGYVATKVMAYGGQACVSAEDPDPSQLFVPGLEGPGGQTAAISNLQFCVVEVLELENTVYIGYEDRPGEGDFDYNDFGMDTDIQETYSGGELSEISLEFTSRVYKAGDSHLIHIERSLPGDVEYDYTVSRSGGTDLVTGNVVAAGSGNSSGSFDFTLFDTGPVGYLESYDDSTVTITIDITAGGDLVSPPTTSPRPDVAANNPLFEVYDPYMVNTSQTETIRLGTVRNNVDKGEADWTLDIDVPNIIVVPEAANFTPPDEQVTITADYPDFDNYYGADAGDDDSDIEVNDTFDDWFSP